MSAAMCTAANTYTLPMPTAYICDHTAYTTQANTRAHKVTYGLMWRNHTHTHSPVAVHTAATPAQATPQAAIGETQTHMSSKQTYTQHTHVVTAEHTNENIEDQHRMLCTSLCSHLFMYSPRCGSGQWGNTQK